MVKVPQVSQSTRGLPVNAKVLSREVASPTIAGVRRVHEERVAAGLTPEILGTTLRDASEGQARSYLTLAEEMEERYLHYASQLQTRRLAIESVDVTVEAGDGVKSEIVDAVGELVDQPNFGQALAALTDGIAKGLGVVEMMWEYERGKLQPVDYIFRDPRFFVFDRLSLSELRLATDGTIDGVELPTAKFLRHLPTAKMGIPYRRGLARPAAWAYMIQQFGLQDWAAFSEVFGMPLRVGKYHAGASENDKRTLLKAVAAIANDAAAIIPSGMEIDFHEVNGQRGEAVFGGLLDYVDKQISKLVVGQTMTSDDGASLGQAKIHNEVRLDILRADCKQLAYTANRDLIRYFIDFNFGPQEVYPWLEMPVPDPEDLEVLSNSLSRLVPLGLKVGQREVRDKMGLSDPGEDEDLLVAPKKTAPAVDPEEDDQSQTPPQKDKRPGNAKLHAGSCRCGSCLATLAAETGDEDAIAEIDALLESGMEEWEQLAAPIVDPIARILEEANDFDEAIAMLEAEGPDATELANRLARLTAIARGVGDVSD